MTNFRRSISYPSDVIITSLKSKLKGNKLTLSGPKDINIKSPILSEMNFQSPRSGILSQSILNGNA